MHYLKGLAIRLALCFVPVSFFSFLFTPLTIYGSYLVLSILFDVSVNGRVLLVNGFPFGIIEACVASIAYYLLWLLVLLTKGITTAVRVKIMFYGSLLIFGMNIFRIWLLIFLAMKYSFHWFNVVHMAFWHFVTGIFVALVWIFLVVHYKIRAVPIYSDLKTIYNLGRKDGRSKRPRKNV